MTPPTRIADQVRVEQTGCWRWTGYVTPKGYGQAGRNTPAHRHVFEALVGPIPDGMELDHVCHTRSRDCPGGNTCQHRRCVNPEHLEPVTPAENVRRSPIVGTVGNDRKGRSGDENHNGAKTHCAQGHPFDEANTYHRPGGGRTCRACNRDNQRRRKADLFGRMIEARVEVSA